MKLLKPTPLSGAASFAFLLLRVAVGVSLAFHGWDKVDGGAMDWSGGTYPDWIEACTSYGELLGGAALALGFLTPLCSLGLLVIMGGALYHHISAGDAFSVWEKAAVYFAAVMVFFTTGPGKMSLDNVLFNKKG